MNTIDQTKWAIEVPALTFVRASRGRASQPFKLELDHRICFASGELVCVMGANGSGKSTFLRLLNGVDHNVNRAENKWFSSQLNRDEIKLWQRSLSQYTLLDLAKTRAALQQFEQASGLSVEACVRLSEHPFGGTKQFNHESSPIDACLKAFGLYDLKQVPLDELSGGQRQRAHLARVLWQCELIFEAGLNPPILIMDEPMNHLDFNGQKQLITQLLKLKARGALILVSSHLLDVVHVASRCVLFEKGRLVRDMVWSNETASERFVLIEQLLGGD